MAKRMMYVVVDHPTKTVFTTEDKQYTLRSEFSVDLGAAHSADDELGSAWARQFALTLAQSYNYTVKYSDSDSQANIKFYFVLCPRNGKAFEAVEWASSADEALTKICTKLNINARDYNIFVFKGGIPEVNYVSGNHCGWISKDNWEQG